MSSPPSRGPVGGGWSGCGSAARGEAGTPAMTGRPGDGIGQEALDLGAVLRREAATAFSTQYVAPVRESMEPEARFLEPLTGAGEGVVIEDRQDMLDLGSRRAQAAREVELAA